MSVPRRAAFGIPAPRLLVLDRTRLTVNEGSTATFRVRLSRIPSGNVTVAARSNDTDEATISPNSRTFTRTNWEDWQTFTVSGVHDTDPTNEDTSILLTSSGGGYRDTASLAVTVFDDDVRGVRTSANSVSFPESVSRRTINVRLQTLPTGTVTVDASSSATGVVTVSPSSRSFTTANWNRDQSFNLDVPAARRSNGTATITFDPSGADYGTVADKTVSVSVTRLPNAVAPTITIDAIPTGNEGSTVGLSFTATGGTYDRLTYAWTVTGGALSSATAASPTLTRPSVTSNRNFTARLTVTAHGSGSRARNGTSAVATQATRTFTVNNTDTTTNTDSIFRRSAAKPTRPTGGTNSATHLPTGWSRTRPSAIIGQGVWRSQRTRTYLNGVFQSATEWSDPTEVDEAVVSPDIETDKDSLTVDEGSTGTFRVRLTAQPTATATVSVASDDTDAATVSPNSLDFTTGNWETYQTVTVSGVEDNVAGNKSATVNLSASGGGVTDTHAVSVTVRDNDRKEVRVSDATLSLAEADNSKTLGVFLGTEPTGDVTVAASVSPGIVGVSPGSRVYDDTDFNSQKFFTFSRRTGQHGSATITLNPSGADYGSVANRTVALTVAERFEAGGLDIEDAAPSVAGGSSVNLRVRLTQKPRSNVTVALTETSSLISLGTASLTFTSSNWNTYQTVAVSASGNRQNFNLPSGSWTSFGSFGQGWAGLGSVTSQIINGLTQNSNPARWLSQFFVSSAGSINLILSNTSSGGRDNQDLSSAFETQGGIDVTVGNASWSFNLASADTAEPYEWTPSNSTDAIAFNSAVSSRIAGTLILRDYTPGSATVSLAASGPSEYAGVSGSAAVSVT